MIIGIVTPSYLRVKFLRRFLRLMPRQTYADWRLIIVHDGPSLEVKSFVDRARAQDSRIAYAETQERANNYGVTPRAEGLRYMIREVGADYCVLWDDDGYFHKDALQQIVKSLEEAGRPDLLLVPMRYGQKLVPQPGASPEKLDWGDLDTGSIVIRPKLGLEGYEELLRKDSKYYCGNSYCAGFPLVPCIREERPEVRICVASCPPVGVHDGLRTQVYLRHLLGIPPLGIGTRLLSRDAWNPRGSA